ncbi:MAG TPA: FkbM family methyltransferase [Allosphingosinicella sp.]|nr:FkbM family methyltransferase [Allosphingosinicella sp.]
MRRDTPSDSPPLAAAPGADAPLIYDLGMHKGEDAEFYLKKGFRVVAVEANPELCALAAARLLPHVESGRLTILNLAVAEAPGSRPFYRSERTEWGTLRPEWAAIKSKRGARFEEIAVEAVPLDEIVRAHGEPYFLKIDIEGMDVAALRSLSGTGFRPSYVSLESSVPVEEQIGLLGEMGYDRFKIVQQRWVKFQRPPRPAREGRFVRHRFAGGASGLFGEEAPGRWLTAEQALRRYRRIFLGHRLYGDPPVFGGRPARRLLDLLRIHPGWHDTHARHSSVER